MTETAVVAVSGSDLPTQHTDRRFMVELTDMAQGGFEASLAAMSKGELKKSALNVAVQYYDFQMGKPETFMFLGVTEMTTQDGEVLPALVLMDAAKNTFVNQATVLVDAVLKAKVEVYQWVDITWTGTKKTGKGNQVRLWAVYPYTAI